MLLVYALESVHWLLIARRAKDFGPACLEVVVPSLESRAVRMSAFLAAIKQRERDLEAIQRRVRM